MKETKDGIGKAGECHGVKGFSCLPENVLLVSCNPGVYCYSREIPPFHHQFYVNQLYLEGIGIIEIERDDCGA